MIYYFAQLFSRRAHGLEGGAFVADINGDGLEDIVYVRDGRFRWYENLGRIVNGSSFSLEQDLGPIADGVSGAFNIYPDNYTAEMKSASILDMNGDGKTDLLIRVYHSVWEPDPRPDCQYQIQSEPSFRTQENQNTQSIGCGSWVTWSSVKLFTSTGSSLIELQDLGNIVDVRAVDLNGDGYTDIMYRSNNRWFYRLSTGRQLLPPRQSNLPTVANNLVGLTYFIDINGDGRTDVLIPTSSSNWNIYLSRPTEMAEQVLFEMRGSRRFDNNAMIQFADINADGKLDLLTSTNDNGWKIFHSLRPHVNEYAINKITNGWGVTTNIEYKNITNKAVYFRDASSNNISSDFFSPRAGMYVVSRVSSEVNPNQFVSIRYQYGGLLLHKKGRGMLGFEVLRTRDEQTNVITETVYNQLWPFTGIPKTTTQVVNVAGTDRILSFAKNTVDQRATAQGGVFPFISASEEISYQLGTNNQHYTLAKITSSFSYDSYGNLLENTVEQSDTTNSSQKLTTNTINNYGNSVTHQRYGRLASSSVTKTLNGQSISRESAFTYYSGAEGLLLRTEILAPSSQEHKSLTEYEYDAAGNITRRSTTAGTNATGSATATRFTQSVFDSRMRYLKETSNQLGDKTVYTYNGQSADTVTGRINFINTVDANNQTSRQHFNVLGQNTRNDIKGHSSSDPIINNYTEQHYCSQLAGGCGVNGAYARVRQYADGGGEQLQFLDKYGREIATHTRLLTGNWSVTRTTYDAQGRPEYSYEPGIGAASSHFSRVEYDSLGRVHKTHLASGGFTEISYQGFLTVSIDPTGKMQQTLSNYLGQTQRVTDHLGNILDYEYDAYGNLLTVHAQSVAGERSLRMRNTYDAYGRKFRMWDQDKSASANPNTGGWNYSYNGFGELLSQTDAKNQTTAFEYDAIGRMLRRVDPSGTTCWEYGNSAASYNRGQLTRVRSFNSNVACSSTATPAYQETYTYNSRALPSGKLVSTAGSSFAVSSSYDAFNRLHLLTYPSWTLNPADDVVVRHQYQNGVLERLVDNKTNVVYQRLANVNARGQATQVVYGNGVTEDRNFYAASGWLDTLTVKRGAAHVHNMDYNYDRVGNVTQRQLSFGNVGSSAGFSEAFVYDDLHRVKTRTITNLGGSTGYAALPAALRMNENYNYDHFGNLTSKSGVGNYCYTATNAAGIRLTNRLTAVGSASNCTGTGAYTFSYDNNGNVTADGKRTFTYTAFDKPSRVTQGANHTDYVYGPNRELYRRTDIRNNQTTDTVYIGGLYERTTLPSAVTEHKFYAGNVVITRRSNNAHDEFYLHKDGQGSTSSITNRQGNVLQQFIYYPWGRQYSVNTNSLFTTYSNPGTSKGYTGHNMVNDFEVIHMGGRTYNPILGRFMQADPFVQAPANLQNYNRYSYVLNNPMSYTDPSGYFFKKLVKGVMELTGSNKVLKELSRNKYLNMAVQAGVCFYGGPVACGAYSGAQTFAVTGSLRAGVKSGLITYGTALAFQEIGNQFSDASMSNIGDALANNGNFSGLVEFGGNLLTGGQVAAQISLHALVGGIGASLQGGNFGHGFFSAGVTKGAGGAWLPGGGKLSGGQVAYGTVVSAVIGGTASVIAGGKFENGAKTAVFQYLYNQASISYRQIVKDVYRTWNEYWATANSLETEMCNKYAGTDCVPLAFSVGISGTGAGALVTGSLQLARISLGFSATKWAFSDQSAEGLGWLALDAATMGSGAFFRSAGLQGMDHVIGVYSYLFQLPGNFNQQIFPQNNNKCSAPMRCE